MSDDDSLDTLYNAFNDRIYDLQDFLHNEEYCTSEVKTAIDENLMKMKNIFLKVATGGNYNKIHDFQGLISAPFTAFKPNGDINPDVIPKYVDHLLKLGVKGVFVNGTTGEGLSLTVQERKSVAEEWVKYGKDKLELIIIQVGANSVKDAKELAAHAEEIGATGIAALPPLFYKPQTLDHLVAYFKEIASAAPSSPLMLYHIPSYSGVEFPLGELLPKARRAIPTFIGAKFTSTDVRDLLKCHYISGEPFKLLSGFDEVLLPCLSSGVTAAVGATYNFMAPLSLRILDAFNKGDVALAREHQNKVSKAIEIIVKYGPGISCLKATMNILGPLDFGPPRLPLAPLDAKALSDLAGDLKTLNARDWATI